MPAPPTARLNAAVRIDLRRKQVAAMYIAGATQEEIAEQVGVTQATVSLDIKALRERWQASAKRDLEAKLADELARLDATECEAWDAWQRSRRPIKRGSYLIERNGDPRYLDVIRHCVELRLKVMGALRPNQTSVNLVNINWDALSLGDQGTTADPIENEIARLLPPPTPTESESVREGE